MMITKMIIVDGTNIEGERCFIRSKKFYFEFFFGMKKTTEVK